MSWTIRAVRSGTPSPRDLMQEIKQHVSHALQVSQQGVALYPYSPDKSVLDSYIASIFTTMVRTLEDIPEMLDENVTEADLTPPQEDIE